MAGGTSAGPSSSCLVICPDLGHPVSKAAAPTNAAAIQRERDALLGHVDTIQRERDALRGHAETIRREHDALLGHVENLERILSKTRALWTYRVLGGVRRLLFPKKPA